MQQARSSHTATALATGAVLIAGGDASGVLEGAELFTLRGDRCARPADCLGAPCVDGICCDRACDGQCEACDVKPGTCVAIAGPPRGGRAPCRSGLTCDATTAACAPVGPGRCDGDTAVGEGGRRVDCAPYACAGGTCRTRCGSVADCASPSVCDPGGSCIERPRDGAGGCTSGGATPCPATIPIMLVGLIVARRRRVR